MINLVYIYIYIKTEIPNLAQHEYPSFTIYLYNFFSQSLKKNINYS